MDKEKLSTILIELRTELERIYGERLYRLILYGSQARGDAEPDSDIDVMLVLEGDVSVGSEIRRIETIKSEISLRHNVAIFCSYVSRQRFEQEESPFLINVRREGVAA